MAVEGGDEAELAEGLEDEPAGGFAGPAVVDVEAAYFGVGGEVAADFAFDEAEDQQGQADHGDQSGDPSVAAQEDRCDGERAFELAVAAFDPSPDSARVIDAVLFGVVLVLVLVRARRESGDDAGWSLTPRVAAIPERLTFGIDVISWRRPSTHVS